MTKKQKNMLTRILITFVMFAVLLVLEHTGIMEKMGNPVVELLLHLIPYLLIGYDIIWKRSKKYQTRTGI